MLMFVQRDITIPLVYPDMRSPGLLLFLWHVILTNQRVFISSLIKLLLAVSVHFPSPFLHSLRAFSSPSPFPLFSSLCSNFAFSLMPSTKRWHSPEVYHPCFNCRMAAMVFLSCVNSDAHSSIGIKAL